MARYYLRQDNALHEVKDKNGLRVTGGGLEKGNHPEDPEMIQRPPMFGGGAVRFRPGSVAFGFKDHGFHVVGPGEFVDLPEILTVNQVKNMVPQLLTKKEAMEIGLANEDGSLRAPISERARTKAQSQIAVNP